VLEEYAVIAERLDCRRIERMDGGDMVLPVESGNEDCFGAKPVGEEGVRSGVRAVIVEFADVAEC
jgi:hypothetical protein